MCLPAAGLQAYRGVLVPASDVWSFGCLLSMVSLPRTHMLCSTCLWSAWLLVGMPPACQRFVARLLPNKCLLMQAPILHVRADRQGAHDTALTAAALLPFPTTQMLTGVVPHDTLHQAQAIMGVVHGTLDYRLPDWVPPQLAALCASCL